MISIKNNQIKMNLIKKISINIQDDIEQEQFDQNEPIKNNPIKMKLIKINPMDPMLLKMLPPKYRRSDYFSSSKKKWPVLFRR